MRKPTYEEFCKQNGLYCGSGSSTGAVSLTGESKQRRGHGMSVSELQDVRYRPQLTSTGMPLVDARSFYEEGRKQMQEEQTPAAVSAPATQNAPVRMQTDTPSQAAMRQRVENLTSKSQTTGRQPLVPGVPGLEIAAQPYAKNLQQRNNTQGIVRSEPVNLAKGAQELATHLKNSFHSDSEVQQAAAESPQEIMAKQQTGGKLTDMEKNRLYDTFNAYLDGNENAKKLFLQERGGDRYGTAAQIRNGMSAQELAEYERMKQMYDAYGSAYSGMHRVYNTTAGTLTDIVGSIGMGADTAIKEAQNTAKNLQNKDYRDAARQMSGYDRYVNTDKSNLDGIKEDANIGPENGFYQAAQTSAQMNAGAQAGETVAGRILHSGVAGAAENLMVGSVNQKLVLPLLSAQGAGEAISGGVESGKGNTQIAQNAAAKFAAGWIINSVGTEQMMQSMGYAATKNSLAASIVSWMRDKSALSWMAHNTPTLYAMVSGGLDNGVQAFAETYADAAIDAATASKGENVSVPSILTALESGAEGAIGGTLGGLGGSIMGQANAALDAVAEGKANSFQKYFRAQQQAQKQEAADWNAQKQADRENAEALGMTAAQYQAEKERQAEQIQSAQAQGWDPTFLFQQNADAEKPATEAANAEKNGADIDFSKGIPADLFFEEGRADNKTWQQLAEIQKNEQKPAAEGIDPTIFFPEAASQLNANRSEPADDANFRSLEKTDPTRYRDNDLQEQGDNVKTAAELSRMLMQHNAAGGQQPTMRQESQNAQRELLAAQKAAGATADSFENDAGQTENEVLAKQLQAQQAAMQQERYNRKQGEQQERIGRMYNKLAQEYAKPTETSHIPAVGGLRNIVGEVLTMVDPGSTAMDRQGVQTQQAQDIQRRIAEVKAQLKAEGTGGELAESMGQAEYADLRDSLDSLTELLNSDAAWEDSHIYEGRTSRNMTLEAKTACVNLMTQIQHRIQMANKAYSKQFTKSMSQLRSSAADEVKSSGNPVDVGSSAKTFLNTQTINYLTPKRLFNRLSGYTHNGTFSEMYSALNQAAIDTKNYELEGNSFFSQLAKKEGIVQRFNAFVLREKTNAEKLSSFTGSKAEQITLHSQNQLGQDVKFTATPAMLANMADVWSHNKAAVEQSGFTVPDVKLYYQGKIADAYAQGVEIKPTVEQLDAWHRQFAAPDKIGGAWAAAISNYEAYITPIKAKVQEDVDGFTNMLDNDHRTLYRNQDFVQRDSDADLRDSALRHFGFTKYRQSGAIQPIRAMDITDYAARQVKDDALYAGMTKATRDFSKIYDGKIFTEQRTPDGHRVSSKSLKGLIAQQYGEAATRYIDNMMQDLKGTPRADTSALLNKLLSNVAGASLSMNLISTPIKQSPSLWAAASVVGMKSLYRTVAMQNHGYQLSLDAIQKYTPLLAIRSSEGGSQELAALKGDHGGISGFTAQLPGSKLITWVDMQTVKALWSASADYVHSRNAALDVGSEAFHKATAEIFNRCVQETQPNYSVMQRSEMQRSGNLFYKVLGQFKTQQTQDGNAIYDAIADYQKNKGTAYAQEAKEHLRDTIAGQTMQAVSFIAFANVARLLMHQFRYWKDKDGEVTAESLAKSVGSDILDTLAGMVPGGDIIMEAMHGYDYSNVTTDIVNDFKDSIGDAIGQSTKLAEGETTWDKAGPKIIKDACSLLDLIGLPATSTKRLYNSISGWMQDIENKTLDYAGKESAYSTDHYSEVFNDQSETGMSPEETKLWYACFTGKKDSEAVKDGDPAGSTMSYYQNRTDDQGAAAVDQQLDKVFDGIMTTYMVMGYSAEDAERMAKQSRVLPSSTLITSVTDEDGHTKDLTGAEIVQANEARENISYQMLKQCFAANMPDDVRQDALGRIQTYAADTAKEAVGGKPLKGWEATVQQQTAQKPVSAAQAYEEEWEAVFAYSIIQNAEGRKSATGRTISGSKRIEAIKNLQKELGCSNGEAVLWYEAFGG